MKHYMLLLLFLAFGTLQAQVLEPGKPDENGFDPERLQRIDNVIQEYISKGHIKGAVGFIAHDGKIVYDKAFGKGGSKPDTPLKTDDIFRIASQTKAITSVGVMMLFEEGKLLLDDRLSKYIPAFANPQVLDVFNPKDSTYTTKPASREITIRDLLTHTSGLEYAQIGSEKMRAIYAKAGVEAGFVNRKKTLAVDIDKLGKLPLAINPGEKFIYGLSTDVLGRVIEVVSGMPLDRFFQERIFGPLGMVDTYFDLPEAKANRLVTVFTENQSTKKIEVWDNKAFPGTDIQYPVKRYGYYSGGAGLVSTVKDYAIFLQMLVNDGKYGGKQFLSRHTVKMMSENQLGTIPFSDNEFGLGFEITTAKGSLQLGMTEGSIAWGGFFGTMYWADPKEKVVGLLFLQQWPLSTDLHNKFRALVYQALK